MKSAVRLPTIEEAERALAKASDFIMRAQVAHPHEFGAATGMWFSSTGFQEPEHEGRRRSKQMPDKIKKRTCSLSFDAVKIDSLFPVLDALAWLDLPTMPQVSQFAGIDSRTTGKLLKNCLTIGVVQRTAEDTHILALPYPYKGSAEQKTAVIREALVRMPLMRYLRQFMVLGDAVDISLRKAATVVGVENFDAKAFNPLMKWATQLRVLDPKLRPDSLVNDAVAEKGKRQEGASPVVFLSHSSKDKPFVRQLAADLSANDVTVWLDEQMIRVGDSIVEKIGQGLATSDYFLIALSENSMGSEWVKRELNQALIHEIESRKVKVLPVKMSECEIPTLIKDKKFADFSVDYGTGLQELLEVLRKR